MSRHTWKSAAARIRFCRRGRVEFFDGGALREGVNPDTAHDIVRVVADQAQPPQVPYRLPCRVRRDHRRSGLSESAVAFAGLSVL